VCFQDIFIRDASEKDAPKLQPLLEALEYPASIQQVEERLKTYEELGYKVLLAVKGETVVGFIALSFSELFVSQTKKAHIEALIVGEGFKGRGLGRLLLKKAEEVAQARGCHIIDLTSGKRRKSSGTHEFYKKLGYNNEGYWAKDYLRKKLR